MIVAGAVDRCSDGHGGAGHEIVVATPGGVVPHVDGSEQIALEQEETLRSAEELRHPIELADARLEDYDAVYYPGGPRPDGGPVGGRRLGATADRALASGKPLAIVCHAPVAIMATRRKGESPFAGYRFTCYTNSEEDALGLREKARWTVEDEHQILDALS